MMAPMLTPQPAVSLIERICNLCGCAPCESPTSCRMTARQESDEWIDAEIEEGLAKVSELWT